MTAKRSCEKSCRMATVVKIAPAQMNRIECFYLYELASDLHSLWNKGNEIPSLRFLQEDDKATHGKNRLVRSVCVVISAGLGSM